MGYILDNLQGNGEITGDLLENLKNATFPTPLLAYKERGATVELAGKEKVDKSAPSRGISSMPRTYLPARLVLKLDIPEAGGEVEQTSDLSDYRVVDGIKIPFAIKVSSAQGFTVTVAKVEHNVKIDETLFSRPAK